MTAAAVELRADLPDWSAPLWEPWRYKIMYGGRGASRSWTVARSLLIKAANSPKRILCTREFQTSIHDSVHQLLRDQIELLGITGYTVTDYEIRHACGSVFLFEGLRRNIKKIKSMEGIDIAWVEEAENITKESWDILLPTIRKEGSEIWITFNPDEEEDNTYVRFVKTPPPGAWVKKVNWRDNPWFPRALQLEKDHAYRVDPDSADHIWEGETRKRSAAQILSGKWVIDTFTVQPYHTDEEQCGDLALGRRCSHGWDGPYQGMDFGFSTDPLAATRKWIHARKLYIEYEVYSLGVELDHIATHVALAIPGFGNYTTRADSSRPDSISFLRRHGLPRIIGAKKGPGSVEDGIAHLRSYDQIIIHPRCKHWAEEAKLYKYKVDERSGDVLPEIIDKHNHLIDASRYGLEPMIKPMRRVGLLFAGNSASTRSR